jgi:hypothetical protein
MRLISGVLPFTLRDAGFVRKRTGMDEMVPRVGAALIGTVIVYSIGRSWKGPEWLLLGAFLLGLLGLLLIAVPPWPTLGELLVWGAIGGMVGAAIVWYHWRRRLRAAR